MPIYIMSEHLHSISTAAPYTQSTQFELGTNSQGGTIQLLQKTRKRDAAECKWS